MNNHPLPLLEKEGLFISSFLLTLKLFLSSFFKKETIFAMVAIIVISILIYLHPITALTQDLGRHVKLGEIIWQTKHIPTTNLFSYTEPERSFINHHWGGEVLFYGLQQLLGWNGLLLIMVLVSVGAILITFLYSIRRSSVPASLLAFFVLAPILLERTDIRPEMFGYLFFSLIYVLLGRSLMTFTNRRKVLLYAFLCSLIFFAWCNIHISFVFGGALFGLWLVDVCRRALFMKEKKSKKPIIRFWPNFFLFSLIAGLGFVGNANGIRGILAPFTIFQQYGYSIEENQHVFYLLELTGNQMIWYFFIGFGIYIGAVFAGVKKYTFIEFGISVCCAVLSFVAIRNFPFFVISAMPVVAVGFQAFIDHLNSVIKSGKNIHLRPLLYPVLAVLTGVYCLVILFQYRTFVRPASLRQMRIGFGVERSLQGAVDFFLANHMTGPIFNNFDAGSYLIYRLYPQERVFVDGRPEAYSVDFFQKTYIPMQLYSSFWKEKERQYGLQSVIFSHGDMTDWGKSFLAILAKDPEWAMVYLDEKGVVYAKRITAYEQLIKTHEIKPLTMQIPPRIATIPDESEAYTRMAYFFYVLGRMDLAVWYQEQAALLQQS